MDAELAAILVDLEARAKYGKIEGVAMPLLVHAKALSHRLQQQFSSSGVEIRARFGSEVTRLAGQLDAVELALSASCHGDRRHIVQ